MIAKTQFLRAWLSIGIQSFGGGAATLYLIRRTAVERHGWLSNEEFTRDWGICQIAPGINLSLDALVSEEIAFEDAPRALPAVLASAAGLAPVIRYPGA